MPGEDLVLKTMSEDVLKEKFPAVHSSIEAAGHKKGYSDGFTAGEAKGRESGKAEGSAAERQRIQDVLAQSLPGHEALVNTLAFDGKTSGPEAAVKVLQAEREKCGSRYQAMKDAAPKPLPPSFASTEAESTANQNLPVEDRCKAEWDKNPNIRAEFESLTTYTAYVKAYEAGRVKILSKEERR